MAGESEPTRIMMGVNESTIKGYPHASISSKGAFEWTLEKIIRSNFSGFKLLFLHVQVPDEDGFDDMDSVYASPDDFKRMNRKDMIRGLHLLEYFVNRCHELGVLLKLETLFEVLRNPLPRGFSQLLMHHTQSQYVDCLDPPISVISIGKRYSPFGSQSLQWNLVGSLRSMA